jgi:hypothetical protein
MQGFREVIVTFAHYTEDSATMKTPLFPVLTLLAGAAALAEAQNTRTGPRRSWSAARG